MIKHDELLLKDLRFQPIWLMIAYVVIALISFSVGLGIEYSISKWLCGGGGFLIALGAEKLVSRRIRFAAKRLLDSSLIEKL